MNLAFFFKTDIYEISIKMSKMCPKRLKFVNLYYHLNKRWIQVIKPAGVGGINCNTWFVLEKKDQGFLMF